MKQKNGMRGIVAFGLACGAVGCSNGPAVVPGPVPAEAATPIASSAAPVFHTIMPNDVISVRVMRETDLSSDSIRIGESGTFVMPLIGSVQAAGRTPEDVAEDIRGRLGANYLVDPQVAVNVVQLESRIVTVEGAAKKPGMYQFVPGTTLIGAIALAGGPGVNVAKLDEVAVFRTIEGQPMVAVFDLKRVRAGIDPDPLILPGDKVVIGYSVLGQAFENILRAIPAINVFTNY